MSGPARRITGLALATVCAAGALALPAAAASAAVPAATSGACTNANDVTLVVDYGPLGGGVQTQCVGNGSTPYVGTGLAVLNAAGLNPQGTNHDGPGFVCRIGGRPSSTQPLAITGNPGYTEKCVLTPPAAAYWSYWHATNGGNWVYSSSGAANRKAIPGGFEGWRFQLNATATSNQPPNAGTTRPAAPPVATVPAPPPPGEGSTPPAGGGSNPPSSGVGSATRAGTPGAPGNPGSASAGAGAAASATTPGTASGTSSVAPTTTDPGATTSGAAGGDPTGSANATGSPVAIDAAPAAVHTTSDSTGAGPTIAVLAALIAAGAATAVAVRRRRAR